MPRAFLEDGAVAVGFSSPESTATFDGESGESDVRDRFDSFGLEDKNVLVRYRSHRNNVKSEGILVGSLACTTFPSSGISNTRIRIYFGLLFAHFEHPSKDLIIVLSVSGVHCSPSLMVHVFRRWLR